MLSLQRRESVDILPQTGLFPHSRINIGPHGFLQARSQPDDIPYVVVLGVPIEAALLPWLREADEDTVPRNLADAAKLAKMGFLDRRMHYRALLDQHKAKAEIGSQEHIWLIEEFERWTRMDEEDVALTLNRWLLKPYHEYMQDQHEHWLWRRPYEPDSKPYVPSWHNVKRARVYQMLWPIVRPNEPLDPGARPRQMCDEHQCVNPRHFEDVSGRPWTFQGGPGKGRADAMRSGKNYPRSLCYERNVDGLPTLFCANGHMLLGDWQRLVRDPDAPSRDTVYCHEHQVLWERWNIHRRVRKAKPHETPDGRWARDMEDMNAEKDFVQGLIAAGVPIVDTATWNQPTPEQPEDPEDVEANPDDYDEEQITKAMIEHLRKQQEEPADPA